VLRGFLTVGLWTMLSRVLGFCRDIAIAATLGAGPVAEAFLVAFSLPNLFRRFFAEGAFNMAFVPMFSKKVEAGDDAHGFARDALSLLLVVVLVLVVIAMVAMPWFVWAMAAGFVGDERFDLAVLYGRIAFPYILFISLAALLSGVLNAQRKFAAAAAAPVLLNIVFLAAIGFALSSGRDVGPALAWAVPLAGIAQLALVWTAASRAGFRLTPRWPRITPEMKRLAIIAAPAALAGGVAQVNLLVGRQVASFFDGAIAWLSYADRLYQLPLGVVGVAVGVVLLPNLSRHLQAGDAAAGQGALSRATEFALGLTVPAAVALAVIPTSLVSVLFERGAFEAQDTAQTAKAVAIYGLGLPAFVLQKVWQPIYFAREDTKRPFYFALAAMVVNAVLAIGLIPWIGFLSAAIAASVSAWAMFGLLWWYARGLGDAARLDDRARRRVPLIVVSSLVMGAALALLETLLSGALGQAGLRYGALAILVGTGGALYFATAHITGAMRLNEVRGALRR